MPAVADYLNPDLPAGLARVTMPVVDATAAALDGYGRLVDDPATCAIEIVRWPARGRRPVDPDTGDEAGTTEGTFVSEWKGDVLYGRNEAVDGHYILAYGEEPAARRSDARARPPAHPALACELSSGRRAALLPARAKAVLRAARAAWRRRDARPISSASASTAAVASTSIPTSGTRACSRCPARHRFFDKQGAVHARVSVDFAREFGCLLEAPIA